MFRFRCRLVFLLFIVIGRLFRFRLRRLLGGRRSLLLLRLLLLTLRLGGWGVLEYLVAQDDLRARTRVDGLMGDGLEPARRVGVRAAPLLVQDVLERALVDARREQVGQGQALADQESVDQKVLLDHIGRLVELLEGFLARALVVLDAAQWAEEVAACRGENFRVDEGHPAQDGGIVLLRFAE